MRWSSLPKRRPDMVMSCCEARKNPYFNLVEPDATGALHVSKPLPGGVVARQQAPVVYEHAASTYVVDPDYLKRSKGLWEGRVIPYLMPPERCVDIDSRLRFQAGGVSSDEDSRMRRMAEQLTGRTIFITGSGGVLGSTYVRRMLAEGARVVASDLPGHRADALKAAHEGKRELPLLRA